MPPSFNLTQTGGELGGRERELAENKVRSGHGRKGKINWGKKEGQVITEGQGAAQGTKEKTDPIS